MKAINKLVKKRIRKGLIDDNSHLLVNPALRTGVFLHAPELKQMQEKALKIKELWSVREANEGENKKHPSNTHSNLRKGLRVTHSLFLTDLQSSVGERAERNLSLSANKRTHKEIRERQMKVISYDNTQSVNALGTLVEEFALHDALSQEYHSIRTAYPVLTMYNGQSGMEFAQSALSLVHEKDVKPSASMSALEPTHDNAYNANVQTREYALRKKKTIREAPSSMGGRGKRYDSARSASGSASQSLDSLFAKTPLELMDLVVAYYLK